MSLSPVEHELVGDDLEQVLGDDLDRLALLVCKVGAGPGEQVEDRQLGLAQALGNNPLLVLVELLGETDETAQVLVDVEAASVVLGDELLDAPNELDAGGVAVRGARSSVAKRIGRRSPVSERR